MEVSTYEVLYEQITIDLLKKRNIFDINKYIVKPNL